jgi:hypothetical protein
MVDLAEQEALDRALIDKMPTLDMAWPEEMREQWMGWALELLRRAREREDAVLTAYRRESGDGDGHALARRFHETYERLAPSFGYETRADTRQFDPASSNGRLMVAVCSEIARTTSASPDLARLIIAARNVAFGDQGAEAIRELDEASEAFADCLPWDDEPATPIHLQGEDHDGQ